jgi:hypothetical protein
VDIPVGQPDDSLVIHPYVERHLAEIRRLCARFRVQRLELFGSATTLRFDPATSDVDLLVDFEDLDGGYFDAYFGLLESLESLLGLRVDLDVLEALALLERFARDKTFEDYEYDPMLRAAVERQFEIIGEALRRLADQDAETAAGIPELRRIVSFRTS